MRSRLFVVSVALVALWLAGCGPADDAGSDQGRVLTIMTHDAFDASEAVLAAFEAEHGVSVNVLTMSDAGVLTNQAILNKHAPLADVLYGIDNTFLSRALDEDIFVPYESPAAANVPATLRLDPENRVMPVDYGDVCLNYDRAYFDEHDLPVPGSLADLTDPQYAGLLVVQNPASSSPGLAFLLATVAVFGEDGYLDYWTALRDNDVLVVEDWTAAYYGEFSGGSGEGAHPLVVSYASSPPVEVYFSDPPPKVAPTGAVVAPLTCFRQVEFVGILQGTENQELAEAWVDFMLSKTFQEDIPLKMFVFPASSEASLPEVFQQHAQLSEQPVELAPEAIAAGREEWIRAWSEVMLR